MRLALGTGTLSIRARVDQSAVDGSSTADVASDPAHGAGEAGRRIGATIDDDFVKFVIAAAIERAVVEPLQAAAAAAAAAADCTGTMQRGVCLRHFRPHLRCAPQLSPDQTVAQYYSRILCCIEHQRIHLIGRSQFLCL